MISWLIAGSILAVIVSSTVMTAHQIDAQSSIEEIDRSLLDSVINITNHTNPIGTTVQQMIQSTSTTNATSTTQPSTQSRINWGEICRSPLIDPLICEPCETLTSPDGYTLTSEGERVIKCIGGSTLATILGRTDLLSLGPSVGCGN